MSLSSTSRTWDRQAPLRDEPGDLRFNGDRGPLSPKTIRNAYITLSSFFTWTVQEFDLPNPMRGVPAPKYQQAPVEPLTREEAEALLAACDFTQRAETQFQRKFRMRRPTAKRDRAIILTLLDTGLRASELCKLMVGDVDLRSETIANNVVFIVILTSTLWVLLLIHALFGDRVKPTLDRLQAWLERNTRTIVLWILVAFGVFFLIVGMLGLSV